MNKTIKFFISEINKGERLDLFLTNKLEDLTRSYIKKLIEDNNLLKLIKYSKFAAKN